MNSCMEELNFNNYTFFFIETTSNCNLRCKYCYYRKTNRNAEFSADELTRCLSRYDKLILCFLGGEPFMNPMLIEEVMDHPALNHKSIIYASNTNGTMFRKIDPKYLRRFSFHHLSIDGFENTNDYFRGKGVYDKIIDNIGYMRNLSNACLIARMTVSRPDQILDIPKLREHFDAVYWQISNNTNELPADFLDRYLKNLEEIFEYWKATVFTENNFIVIPFVGMCSLIMDGGMEEPNLICGSGTDHFNIGIDGTIHPCPESPHRRGDKEALGTLGRFEPKTYPLKERCIECDILAYCGGRCAMTDHNIYCEGVRQIYEMLKQFVETLVDAQRDDLRNVVDAQRTLSFTTEVTP